MYMYCQLLGCLETTAKGGQPHSLSVTHCTFITLLLY